MDYKERLKDASDRLNYHREKIREATDITTYNITDLLWPCGDNGCPIGTEDYSSDIYYVYAEPHPNEFCRVKAIRNKDGHLEVLLAEPNETGKDEWMDFNRARVVDIRFLIDEIVFNLEYCDGYQPEKEDEFEFLIDEDGSKYNPQTSTLSGGMDIRCDYNEEALFAYKTKKSLPEITAYLLSKGWVKTHENTYHEFRKGNTICFFDDWQRENVKDREFACFGTEYHPVETIDPDDLKKPRTALEAVLRPIKRYSVPFLRTQWADVFVEANTPEEAIENAEKIFSDGLDGWIEWEDIDSPEYDEARGVEEL